MVRERFNEVTHEVRKATKEDAEDMNRLFARAMREADWLPPTAARETDFTRASTDETIFVCVGNGQLTGLISVYEPESFVHHLYVAPEHQRQGVGRALLVSLEPWLAKPWRLKCVTANVVALAFYRSLGWTEIGRGHGDQGEYAILEYNGAS